MKKLRLGVIGACGRGTLADHAHNPQNGVEIVAGADIYEEQRKSFVERYKKEKKCRCDRLCRLSGDDRKRTP